MPMSRIWLPMKPCVFTPGKFHVTSGASRKLKGQNGVSWRPGGVTARTAATTTRPPPRRLSKVTARARLCIAAETRQQAASVSGRQPERGKEEQHLEEDEAAVWRADEPGHATDLVPGIPHPRDHDEAHDGEGPRREAQRGDDREGTRVRPVLAGGGVKEER